ncbi:trypsin-like serine protease [Bdellovibrio bacteriovorus]|uniref:S1 family peptidase n=1 Tax=Bdellovibrio bacteriovorus TaxID=959 RepID=UPI0021D38859|nr:trypsin-like serine protease [Bdellovibrio bacteriovorus]UXR65191.1 trypsin-like serine protease [Bdellovibrio bacteriovorus]
MKALPLLASFSLSLVLGATACSPRSFSQNGSTTEELSFDIIGGTPIHERTSQAARSVVLLDIKNRFGQSLGFCTATLIGPQTILSAAHCFDESRVKGFDHFDVRFTNNYDISNSLSRKGLKFQRHGTYNSTQKYDHDIAVATFEGGIPEGYGPVTVDADTKANYAGQTVYVYGYGRSQDYTGRPNENSWASIGQLHKGVMQIESTYNRFADRYWLNSAVPSFICQGDSGGPQFYHENGVLKVIGVNSAILGKKLPNGFSSCKGIGQATKVAPFAGWIAKTRMKLLNSELTTESSETSLAH